MKMKRTVSVLLLLALVLAFVPGQVFGAGYPDFYNVSFILQDGTVIQHNEHVSYVESVVVPAYQEVSTWYSAEEQMEVKTGERIWADFDRNENVVFVADSVMPESFTLNFRLPNGVYAAQNVQLNPVDFYNFFTVPTVDGAEVAWKAGNVELTGNQMITGQDLDLDYVWYESNPVLNFELVSEPVYPDGFTVRFIDDNDQVVSEQEIDFWTFYSAIEIPEGNWMNYRQRALVNDADYISGQTLDNDFTWYGEHPVVEFFAS